MMWLGRNGKHSNTLLRWDGKTPWSRLFHKLNFIPSWLLHVVHFLLKYPFSNPPPLTNSETGVLQYVNKFYLLSSKFFCSAWTKDCSISFKAPRLSTVKEENIRVDISWIENMYFLCHFLSLFKSLESQTTNSQLTSPLSRERLWIGTRTSSRTGTVKNLRGISAGTEEFS